MRFLSYNPGHDGLALDQLSVRDKERLVKALESGEGVPGRTFRPPTTNTERARKLNAVKLLRAEEIEKTTGLTGPSFLRYQACKNPTRALPKLSSDFTCHEMELSI